MSTMVRGAALLVVTCVLIGSPAATQPIGEPYWVGDFRNADYCQYTTVFESSSVNPDAAPDGYSPACSHYGRYARDASQRVHLTQRPAPPSSTSSRWVSYQEIRTTDGPWYQGSTLAKATIRLSSDQTLDGPFEMGMERWFRVSFYLPARFNWPEDGWQTLFDLHNDVSDPAGNSWPTVQMVVTPTSGHRRFVSLALEGVSARTNRETVKLLQLTKRNGSRIVRAVGKQAAPAAFGRWHTLVLGVRFADDGTVGNSAGWIKAYFDGRSVYAKSRPTVWKNETSVWLQLQNYMQYGKSLVGGATSSVIYFADTRIGRTYASVALDRPPH